MCDNCLEARRLAQDIAEQMQTGERVREFYRRQGECREQERIINLLLDLNVIRRAESDLLVAFDTNGENVIYLTGLETKNESK